MTRLFLYGTLMRGFRNHDRMKSARFLGLARTRDAAFRMVACTAEPPYPFPGVIDGQSRIAGELYAVESDLLRMLDDFEEIGRDYTRETVTLGDGQDAEYYRLIYPDGLPVVRQHEQMHFDVRENCYRWIETR
ncbi:MAG: gamma-glutamylcyclotransferase [Rhodospirillales bacterium]|nr:gamma-glutamylcyclotransferase [Rhodospirillales bacterium]